uniref:Resolvase/invertase-type recombinase catalytic domain-containing protein n=1 Tax=Plectus sambesii TaxID=2011161 RepID=A0A914XTG5_9BILA
MNQAQNRSDVCNVYVDRGCDDRAKRGMERNWLLGRGRHFVIGREPTIGVEGRKAVCVNKARRRPRSRTGRTTSTTAVSATVLPRASRAYSTSVVRAVRAVFPKHHRWH